MEEEERKVKENYELGVMWWVWGGKLLAQWNHAWWVRWAKRGDLFWVIFPW